MLAIALPGCSDSASSHRNIIDVDLPDPLLDGGQWVVNLDNAKAVELEPDLIIGGEVESEGLFLAEPTDMIVVGDSVYIADRKQHAIVVADLQGYLIRLIGRKGRAPGEFIEPVRLAANDDYIFVYDHGNRRVQVFDHRFKYVTSIPYGFIWLGTSIAADNDHLFLPGSTMSDSLMMAVYTAKPPFQRTGGFMPRLLPPGQQPMAHNVSVVTTGGSNICSAYIGLPYVFCFNSHLAEQRTLVFRGGPVEDLDNPIPSRMEFSGDESAAVKSFVMDFALRNDVLFIASPYSPVYIVSLKTNRPLGMLSLPVIGIVDQLYVDDGNLLLLMHTRGDTRIYVYDVVNILDQLGQEVSA